MKIRFLTQDDVAAFWELRLAALHDNPEAFSSSYEEVASKSPEARLALFQQKYLGPNDFIAGAFVNAKLGGMVGLHRETGLKTNHKALVWGVYVAPDLRGQGVGRALIQAVLEQARQIDGLEQLSLGVSVNNAAAQNLYLALGFKPYGCEPHALKIGQTYYDENLMSLNL